jgi:2-polyprenyl-3-methyl-5-hydroxy-6-metoxy-1,4-benzoquinol methylase
MFVLEKSNRALAQDVVRIEKLDEIENVDLVIYAHILEHVNDPLKEIRDLLGISKYIYRDPLWGSSVFQI